MTIEAAIAFRTSLLGVKVMHDGGWVHRDLKPANIGLIGRPPRAVLLDVGVSRYIEPGRSLLPNPGHFGTVGYLAPESELGKYDHAVDIWAMGIVLFQLTYNYHPWKFSKNPWRNGEDNNELRGSFRKSHEKAIDKMAKDYERARASPAKGFLHLGGLFIEMVQYRWPANNDTQRVDIDTVLQHPAWGPLLPESPQAKRPRIRFEGISQG